MGTKGEAEGRSRNAFEHLPLSSPEERPQSLAAGIASPHDTILAQLHKSTAESPSQLRRQASSSQTPFSAHTHSQGQLHDPYDGSLIGPLVLPDVAFHPEAHFPLSEAACKNEEHWTHLSRVLELQIQMANLHVDMEGISNKTNEYGKGKAKTKPSRRTWQPDEKSLEEDEGVDVKDEADEEERLNKEREAEFSRLADQFEGRKEGIREIMSKLDSLSRALTEFHALQSPNIDFPASRKNTSQAQTSPDTLAPISRPSLS